MVMVVLGVYENAIGSKIHPLHIPVLGIQRLIIASPFRFSPQPHDMAQVMLEKGREEERIKKARDNSVLHFYGAFSFRS